MKFRKAILRLKQSFEAFQQCDRIMKLISAYCYNAQENQVIVRVPKEAYHTMWDEFVDIVEWVGRNSVRKNFKNWAENSGYPYFIGRAASSPGTEDEQESESEEEPRKIRKKEEPGRMEEEKNEEGERLLAIVRELKNEKTWEELLEEFLAAKDVLSVQILLDRRASLLDLGTSSKKGTKKQLQSTPKTNFLKIKPPTDKSPIRNNQAQKDPVETCRELIKKGFTVDQAIAALSVMMSGCQEQRLKDHLASYLEELGQLEKSCKDKE